MTSLPASLAEVVSRLRLVDSTLIATVEARTPRPASTGIDPDSKRNPFPGNYIDQLRELGRPAGGTLPSNARYGWVRAE